MSACATRISTRPIRNTPTAGSEPEARSGRRDLPDSREAAFVFCAERRPPVGAINPHNPHESAGVWPISNPGEGGVGREPPLARGFGELGMSLGTDEIEPVQACGSGLGRSQALR